MNRDALFCDGTQDYVIPAEPAINESVRLCFRTAHNDVDEVDLLVEKYRYPMWKARSENGFDYYELSLIHI